MGKEGDCGCAHKGAREKLEAIAEPTLSEDIGPGTCLPWVKIERDPERFRACMRLAERVGRIETSEQLYKLIAPQLEREDQEVYYVIALDTQLMLRGISEVARGARDRVLTPIQDTVRYAMAFAQLYGAMGVAIAHNHPSGQARPSEADKEVTKAVKRAAAANELLFIDHIIVGVSATGKEPAYYSFRDAKQL